jgi:RNA polymerase sigma-70 factor, ECF subfamily
MKEMCGVNEEALVIRAQRGDRRAFAELVSQHHAGVIATARALIGRPEAAEDVGQEAFVEAFRSLPRLERPRKFRSWLFAIVRHRALNHLRSAERDRGLVPLEEVEDWAAETPPATDNRADDVRMRLDALSVRHREILAAKYLEGLSYQEIAQSLGLTVNAVRVRCHRAKEKLRELLSQPDEPSPAAEGVQA